MRSSLLLIGACGALAAGIFACSAPATGEAGETEGRATSTNEPVRCDKAEHIAPSGGLLTLNMAGTRLFEVDDDRHFTMMGLDGSDPVTTELSAPWHVFQVVAVDGDHAYLFGAREEVEGVHNHAIFRVATAGNASAPELLFEAKRPDQIFPGTVSMDHANVYWMGPASEGKSAIYALPREGAAAPQVIATVEDSGLDAPHVLKLDGQRLYTAQGGAPAARAILSVKTDGKGTKAYAAPMDKPEEPSTRGDVKSSSTFRVGPSALYYVGQGFNAAGKRAGAERIWSIAKGDAAAQLLQTFDDKTRLVSLAVDDTTLYAATEVKGAGSVLLRLSGTAPAEPVPVLATGRGRVTQSFVHAGHLYWVISDSGSKDTGTFRIPTNRLSDKSVILCGEAKDPGTRADAGAVAADAATARADASDAASAVDPDAAALPDQPIEDDAGWLTEQGGSGDKGKGRGLAPSYSEDDPETYFPEFTSVPAPKKPGAQPAASGCSSSGRGVPTGPATPLLALGVLLAVRRRRRAR